MCGIRPWCAMRRVFILQRSTAAVTRRGRKGFGPSLAKKKSQEALRLTKQFEMGAQGREVHL